MEVLLPLRMTVQINDSPEEQTVFEIEAPAGSAPMDTLLRAAEVGIRGMLKAFSVHKAKIQKYVGPERVGSPLLYISQQDTMHPVTAKVLPFKRKEEIKQRR